MSERVPVMRTLVVERDLVHPPERVWRALTQSDLLAQWLLPNDFRATVGEKFSFNAEWGRIEGRILAIEPGSSLRYSWHGSGLETVVQWTIEPTSTGARVRIEQTGFRADQKLAYHGARTGWPRFLASLERLLERIE